MLKHLLPNNIQIFYFLTPKKPSIRSNIIILCTTRKLIKLKIITYKTDTLFFLLLQNYFTLTEGTVLHLYTHWFFFMNHYCANKMGRYQQNTLLKIFLKHQYIQSSTALDHITRTCWYCVSLLITIFCGTRSFGAAPVFKVLCRWMQDFVPKCWLDNFWGTWTGSNNYILTDTRPTATVRHKLWDVKMCKNITLK